tara:strand:+ start:194 stop:925 length:732 start_codon:yes stop_codon:yes gene_type:complete
MHILSIEGNIGTGKSTIIRLIKEILSHISKKDINKLDQKYLNLLKQNSSGEFIYNDLEIITEPVDKWLELTDDEDNQNILDKFYRDQERWSYSFQMNAFITRAKDILEHSDKKLIILERSVLTDRNVFAKLLFKDKKISTMEWKLYNEWFDWLTSSFSILPTKVIYLKASPEVSFSRIQKRSRKEESSIPYNYIERVSNAHDEWLYNHQDLTILDADKEFEKDENRKFELIKTIFREINKLLE